MTNNNSPEPLIAKDGFHYCINISEPQGGHSELGSLLGQIYHYLLHQYPISGCG